MPLSEDAALDLQGLSPEGLGLVVTAQPLVRGGEVPRGREDARVLLPENSALDLQGLSLEDLGLLVPPLTRVGVREVAHDQQRTRVLLPKNSALDLQDLSLESLGLLGDDRDPLTSALAAVHAARLMMADAQPATRARAAAINVRLLVKDGRIEAAAARGLTKFVGRKKEMTALKEAFEKAKSGSGQVVGIVGEAGVGKSRILLEVRNMLSGDENTYLEGRCLHYGAAMIYLPILDILRLYFEIKEGEQ